MQVRGAPRDLQPGDPLCAPTSSIMVEAHIALLHSLHRQDSWRDCINTSILSRIGLIKKLYKSFNATDDGRSSSLSSKTTGETTTTTSRKDEGKLSPPGSDESSDKKVEKENTETKDDGGETTETSSDKEEKDNKDETKDEKEEKSEKKGQLGKDDDKGVRKHEGMKETGTFKIM